MMWWNKEQKYRVKKAFRDYQEDKQLVALTRSSLMEPARPSNIGGHVGDVSDPTGRAVTQLERLIWAKEQWVKIIDETIEYFQATDLEPVLFKVCVEGMPVNEAQEALHLSISTIYKYCDDVYMYAFLDATKHGLFAGQVS